MAAGFVAVLLVAELAIRVFGAFLPEPRNWYHDIAQAKVEQLEEMAGEELDILFAGTSQTYYAIGPRLVDASLGTKSYNAAIPAGVPPIQERWLLNQVLERVDTDVVVWGVSVLDLNDGRDLSVVDAYSSAQATRQGALAEVDRWLAGRSGLFQYRHHLVDPNAWAERTKMDAIRSVIRADGQRRPAHRTPSEAERKRLQDQVVSDYKVGGPMAASLRRTIEAVKARGIDVVLVWLPVPERLTALLPDPTVESEAHAETQELAADLGVSFLDVSEGFHDGDFLDYTHMRERASQRFSRQLSHELAFLKPEPTRPTGNWR
jgi:hypothetical protein